jgi:hypothetical protein
MFCHCHRESTRGAWNGGRSFVDTCKDKKQKKKERKKKKTVRKTGIF